jgi:pimeloyl-ACP methyl ester carboxylesterase/ribosomal protein S18 acetylase RimI-like enzyme
MTEPYTSYVDVTLADGACLRAFIYSPAGTPDAPGTPFGITHAQPPLMCLHGNGEDHTIMEPAIQALCQERSVIALDSRGQGASTRGTATLTYERMAEDSLEVLSRLGVTQAHVLGYSDGGIIGLLMAATARHRVLSLTALGANMQPEGLTPEALAAIREELVAASLEQDDAAAELLSLMLTEPHLHPADLRHVVCPVCVMAGEFDMIAPEESERLARSIPHSRLVTVPTAGHDLLHEALPAVLAELAATMHAVDKPLTVRPPRANPQLVVAPVGPERMPEVDVVFEAVLDACEGPDPDTSGWKRGVWPREGAILAYAQEGTLYAAYQRESCDEAGVPFEGAIPLGCMAVDHHMGIAEELLDYADSLAPEEYLVLHSLAVMPSARGMGVADTLLAAFYQQGRDAGVKALRLNTSPDNVSANRLYQSRGMRLNRPVHLAYRGLRLSPWSNLYDLPLT